MKLFDSALWQRCTLCVNGPGQCVEIQSSKKTSANVSMQKIKCVCVCSCVAHRCCGLGGYQSKYCGEENWMADQRF